MTIIINSKKKKKSFDDLIKSCFLKLNYYDYITLGLCYNGRLICYKALLWSLVREIANLEKTKELKFIRFIAELL